MALFLLDRRKIVNLLDKPITAYSYDGSLVTFVPDKERGLGFYYIEEKPLHQNFSLKICHEGIGRNNTKVSMLYTFDEKTRIMPIER